jgi:hypothetical protein
LDDEGGGGNRRRERESIATGRCDGAPDHLQALSDGARNALAGAALRNVQALGQHWAVEHVVRLLPTDRSRPIRADFFHLVDDAREFRLRAVGGKVSIKDYDSTVARIAGNIASGLAARADLYRTSNPRIVAEEREWIQKESVRLARGIVAEVRRQSQEEVEVTR